MTEKKSNLRKVAEGIAREQAALIPENLERMLAAESRQIVHELQIHQIELEIQNEELRQRYCPIMT